MDVDLAPEPSVFFWASTLAKYLATLIREATSEKRIRHP